MSPYQTPNGLSEGDERGAFRGETSRRSQDPQLPSWNVNAPVFVPKAAQQPVNPVAPAPAAQIPQFQGFGGGLGNRPPRGLEQYELDVMMDGYAREQFYQLQQQSPVVRQWNSPAQAPRQEDRNVYSFYSPNSASNDEGTPKKYSPCLITRRLKEQAQMAPPPAPPAPPAPAVNMYANANPNFPQFNMGGPSGARHENDQNRRRVEQQYYYMHQHQQP